MPGRPALVATLLATLACAPEPADRAPAAPATVRPDLLLVTLDTTRADRVAPEGDAEATPNLSALAARGVRFTHAYSTVPTTLPAHLSMMSGLYPAGHGVHENGRRVRDDVGLVAERLRELGYATAAFVSGYPLARRFGLDRGFDLYDDELGEGRNERSASATTDRALAWLDARPAGRPLFLWVHYYDPHEPYAPPEPFRSRFVNDPYLGEIAFVDAELGRVAERFESRPTEVARGLLIVGDHGEGLGDHGEALHGNLLYQGVMRVPLVLIGPELPVAVRDDAVSIRQVRATLLRWAGDAVAGGLAQPTGEAVLGEAMQPFLNYRWQPQTMATDGRFKLIRSGGLELFDLATDPGERRNLIPGAAPPRALAMAVADYPAPAAGSAPPTPIAAEERQRLASLGYIASEGAPAAVPPGAPRAADMAHLFAPLDAASRAFGNADYARAAPILRQILRDDPANLMSAVRLAASESFLGRDREALAAFAAARRIDPDSVEVRHYLAMHHLKQGRLGDAATLFEAVLAAQPDRSAALEGLARIRAAEGRMPETIDLLERALPGAADPSSVLGQIGLVRMSTGDTPGAIAAFERGRAAAPSRFAHDLELGVLYLAARRLDEARDALDRVAPRHYAYPMALFKRAQVSVLLDEADASERIRAALAGADETTRALIAAERLFAGRLPAPTGP